MPNLKGKMARAFSAFPHFGITAPYVRFFRKKTMKQAQPYKKSLLKGLFHRFSG
jgi:hypothetical protein